MHDPMTVAHEIKYPWRKYPKGSKFWPDGYREAVLTIWHRDPERDGSDDSCGWFKRPRHGDQALREKIRRAFESEWDGEHLGWFRTDGQPVLSLQATTLGLFRRAAYIYFGDSWPKAERFLRRHLLEILSFAENRHDSLRDSLTMRFGHEPKDDRIRHMADVIFGCLLRWTQPWYAHPRWHFWHWKIQIHPLQLLKRWVFSRCCHCSGRFGFGESPIAYSWHGTGPRWFRGETKIAHQSCDRIEAQRQVLKTTIKPLDGFGLPN
jgi:hypothetical protein